MKFSEKKYMTQYIAMFGLFSCMSSWDLVYPFKSTEEVYKKCIEKKITWQKLLDFKGYKEGVLL